MPIIVFNSTHHALSAEEILEKEGFEVDVVPLPESARSVCGLALEIHGDAVAPAKDVLSRARIEWKLFEE